MKPKMCEIITSKKFWKILWAFWAAKADWADWTDQANWDRDYTF